MPKLLEARGFSLLPEGYQSREDMVPFINVIGEASMINAWRTQWQEGRQLFAKRFEGDKPTKAVEFGKALKLRGISVVDVISMRKAFPPPLKMREAPKPGLLWCPYCVKWREFLEAEVKYPDFITPVLLRCTTCRISVKDAYVRMYNQELVIQHEMRLEMKAKQRETAKMKKKATEKYSPRGGLRKRR